MNKRKFSDVLEEYLEERDKQNGGDYDDAGWFRVDGLERMRALAQELDDMVEGEDK